MSTYRQSRRVVTMVSLLALCAGWYAMERRLERAPHAGYCPESAQWVAGAANLPACWRALSQQPIAHTAAQEAPQWIHRAELLLRLATGVRPTPARWRTWLGRQALVAGRGSQWCLCVHPGMLLRCADLVNRLAGGGTEAGGIHRYGALYYRWREGFLLVSPWMDLLSAAMTAAPYQPETPWPADGVYLAWQGGWDGHIVVRAEAGLGFTGMAQTPLRFCGDSIPRVDCWPVQPLCAVSGCDGAALLRLAAGAFAALPVTPVTEALRRGGTLLWRRWGLDRLLVAAPGPPRSFSLVCFGLDLSETTPVPELALLLAAHGAPMQQHPVWPVMESAGPLPFVWNGQPGWAAPVLGEKLTLCLAAKKEWWMLTSRESLMTQLLGSAPGIETGEGNMMAVIDWRMFGETAAALLRQAAALELLPGMNLKDTENELVPLTRISAAAGRFFLKTQVFGDATALRGYLAAPRDLTP